MMELTALKLGLAGSARIVVGEEHTAPRVGSGRVRVLATPVMINHERSLYHAIFPLRRPVVEAGRVSAQKLVMLHRK